MRAPLLALYEGAGFVLVDARPLRIGGHDVVRFERVLG
jgi:hypothetical protein